jgi:predicted nucleotidyltransferase
MSNIVIYHNNLCPDIWDENYNLNSGIRLNLLKIAKDFYEKIKFEAPILDIYFMGSMASFNWNIESDIDVHVVIDLKSLKMPEETSEKMAKLVGSQWNSEHDILIKGHKVEMNIQSLTAEKPYVNGIYSLVKNLWIKRPSKQNPNAIDTPSIQLKYGGMKKYILDTIATRDREKLKAAKDYIDAFRQYGLDNDGELSIENITYKLLRTRGIIQQLKDAISNIYDKQLSINEVNQSDLKQRHPVWAGNDLSQLTLDNLNALKNKSVRFYNAAKKSENREMFNQAVKDYIVYRNEIKRRLEIINREFREHLLNEAITHPQSPEFKRWFGNSKVVDKHGNPLVVYHGTNQSISAFSKKRLGISTQSQSSKKAYFFTDNTEVAHAYAEKAGRTIRAGISDYEKKVKELQKKVERLEKHAQSTGNWTPYEKAVEEYENYDIGTSREDDITGQNILPVFLKIENPLVYDFKGLSAFNNETSNLIDMAIKSGNDGLILKNVNDPEPVSTHYIVFKSNQIKSAIGNVGTFSSKHSSIVKEAIGWHGAYQAILLSNPPKLVFTNNDEDTHVAIFRRVFNDEMETLMSQLENAGYGDSDDPDCQYPAANQLADKYNVARCIIERDGICYVNTPKNRELTNSQLRILRDYCIEHKLRLKQGNREIELEEGVGGNPETDKAYVKGDRWRVKCDNAKKTPLMKESISQGLFKWFKQQLPTWPDYVINDMFVVKLKSRKEVEEKREHMNFIKKKYPNMKWELKVLEVTFDIFDRDTQDALKKRDGGKCNPNQVPNDVARHAVQSNLLKSRGVSKEPLIMIKNGNSYSLWEGWHRTIQNLNQFPNGYKCNAWIGIIKKLKIY